MMRKVGLVGGVDGRDVAGCTPGGRGSPGGRGIPGGSGSPGGNPSPGGSGGPGGSNNPGGTGALRRGSGGDVPGGRSAWSAPMSSEPFGIVTERGLSQAEGLIIAEGSFLTILIVVVGGVVVRRDGRLCCEVREIEGVGFGY